MLYKGLELNIEAMENALTFLEGLGYSSGDVHDDLAKALIRSKNRLERLQEMERKAKEWSQSVPSAFRLP